MAIVGAKARVQNREKEGEREEGGGEGDHADRPGRDKARRCDPRDR